MLVHISGLVIGVDEAGRGPLAGPVVAGAVVLGPVLVAGLNDSKKLSARRRAYLEGEIKAHCHWAVGVVEADAIGGGDASEAVISAASIIAKEHRDRIMHGLASQHPEYGWERNAGYGTKVHMEALARLGPTPHHRRSFAPVAAAERSRG